jgi:hypothetical protein
MIKPEVPSNVRPSLSIAPEIVAIFLVLSCSVTVVAQRDQPKPGDFVVSIVESQMDLSHNGLTIHDCMLVLPNGRFHLERRWQQLPSSTASLKVFESSLDKIRLDSLQDIISDQGIKNLPPYVEPKIPMGVPWSSGFNAIISRVPQTQHVGFWLWRGGSSEASPNSMPENIKRGWQESESALRPLVEWFHQAKDLRLEPSATDSNLCGMSERRTE